MSVSLKFTAEFEDHDDGEQKEDVHANDTKSGRKDEVEIVVGERGEWANATHFLRRREWVGTNGIRDERWGLAIQVSTAVELTR